MTSESNSDANFNSGPGSSTALPVVSLKAKSDRRVKQGHCWVYSNEVDVESSGFRTMAVGQQATLHTAHGQILGSGFFNPHALQCGRLYCRQANQLFDKDFIVKQLSKALLWRESCYDKPYYRLVYGDGDHLPGLVVDRYGDTLVMQLNAAGTMAALDDIVQALVEVVKPKGILLRNEKANDIEQLPSHTEVMFGEVPDSVNIIENDVEFIVPIANGQKTGWFYDHRDSRALLARYVGGKRVLDVYSYLGGWGLQAMSQGAASASCIDSSGTALELAEAAAQLAGLAGNMQFIKASAIDALKAMVKEGQRFDVIVLDPPAFIKRRKDQRSGEKAYHHINQLAVKLLTPSGLLVSASCSLHLPRQELTKIVQVAAARAERQAFIIHQGGLGADHPVNVAMPEMDYLKAVFARID